MRVETVTAAGFGLLGAVRATLAGADDVLLCVAFAHERAVLARVPGVEVAPGRPITLRWRGAPGGRG